jgi:hypothetical protein
MPSSSRPTSSAVCLDARRRPDAAATAPEGAPGASCEATPAGKNAEERNCPSFSPPRASPRVFARRRTFGPDPSRMSGPSALRSSVARYHMQAVTFFVTSPQILPGLHRFSTPPCRVPVGPGTSRGAGWRYPPPRGACLGEMSHTPHFFSQPIPDREQPVPVGGRNTRLSLDAPPTLLRRSTLRTRTPHGCQLRSAAGLGRSTNRRSGRTDRHRGDRQSPRPRHRRRLEPRLRSVGAPGLRGGRSPRTRGAAPCAGRGALGASVRPRVVRDRRPHGSRGHPAASGWRPSALSPVESGNPLETQMIFLRRPTPGDLKRFSLPTPLAPDPVLA